MVALLLSLLHTSSLRPSRGQPPRTQQPHSSGTPMAGATARLPRALRLLAALVALASLAAAEEAGAAGEQADAPPSCIEVYSGNPEQPCPGWSQGEYLIAQGRTSQKRPVWHNSGAGKDDALFRWHPRNGWIIGKRTDMSGMSYRCLAGSGVDETPLGCDSYGHPNDVCKVRVCGTAPGTPELGEGAAGSGRREL
jgi:hypothetical protein